MFEASSPTEDEKQLLNAVKLSEKLARSAHGLMMESFTVLISYCNKNTEVIKYYLIKFQAVIIYK